MLRTWVILATLMVVTGCATTPDADYRPLGSTGEPVEGSRYTTHNPYHPRPLADLPQVTDLADEPEETPLDGFSTTHPATSPLSDVLYDHYKEWRGTRYRLGGLSKAGIDCSGFVYVTFLDRLGIELPRSTYYQVKQGQSINRNQLQTGDLVFFRNGKTNHVGIYLENGRFMHSSTKSGVRISSLSNSYWQRTYWTARRLNLPADFQLASH